MKLKQLIKEAQGLLEKHGNLEVTCTMSLLKDGYSKRGDDLEDISESTADNLVVLENETFGKHVKVYW